MAFPSAPSALWSVSLLTVLFAAAVHSNNVYEEDPLQPVTSDETVSVGGTVTLTCHVPESDNSSLQWSNTAQQTLYFGEKRALRDNRIQLHRSTSTELSITIGDVQLSDEGEYTCSIFTMPVRTARATVTVLGVPGKPQISGFENAVPEGGKVTLTCTSTGSKPPARLRWFRGTLELEGRPDVVESVPDDPTYNVSSELDLEVSRSDDNALITCAVNHPSLALGDKRSEQALRVLYRPNVQISPGSDLPREGEKFHLECKGNGNPEPSSYVWEKKDGELPPLAKADGALLRFEMLNKTDDGVYLCNADNGIGSGLGEYTLHVQDPMDLDSLETTSPSFGSPTDTSLPPTSPSSSPTFLPSSSPPDILSGSGSDPTFTSSSPPDLTSTSSPDTSPESSPSPSPSLSTSLSLSSSLSPSPSPSPTTSPSSPSPSSIPTTSDELTTIPEISTTPTTATPLSNVLFPDLTFSPDSTSTSSSPTSSASTTPSAATRSDSPLASSLTPSVSVQLNGGNTITDAADNMPDPTAMSTTSGVDHAVIGGVVAVIVFILLCLLIVLGRYLIRHKGTYLTHEAKGSDDAPDADTAIINAEGGHSGAEDKKEYFI
ncbi:cell adhesion molecule 3 isoform X1 [Labrus mixtus]|uniref:cell adhesion molecule 3 isoform X1 n=1 Tax=Labrus mixtus TaxID=508554 RepID=UPI0029C03044|nr:cell adhesion molecule 3 isoform X1 [Labrus mixtus]